MNQDNITEEVLKDPISYLKGFVDGQQDARQFRCRWCHRRIDWYITYRNWLTGRPSGGKKMSLQGRTTCPLSPDGKYHDPYLGEGTKGDKTERIRT